MVTGAAGAIDRALAERVDGRVAGISSDGSIEVDDRDGPARNLRPDLVEVGRPGSRGRRRWQLVSEVAVTWEQLELF